MLINVNERRLRQKKWGITCFNPVLKNQRFDKPTANSADEEGKKTHVMVLYVP